MPCEKYVRGNERKDRGISIISMRIDQSVRKRKCLRINDSRSDNWETYVSEILLQEYRYPLTAIIDLVEDIYLTLGNASRQMSLHISLHISKITPQR
jgi:hypothetical protein